MFDFLNSDSDYWKPPARLLENKYSELCGEPETGDGKPLGVTQVAEAFMIDFHEIDMIKKNTEWRDFTPKLFGFHYQPKRKLKNGEMTKSVIYIRLGWAFSFYDNIDIAQMQPNKDLKTEVQWNKVHGKEIAQRTHRKSENRLNHKSVNWDGHSINIFHPRFRLDVGRMKNSLWYSEYMGRKREYGHGLPGNRLSDYSRVSHTVLTEGAQKELSEEA